MLARPGVLVPGARQVRLECFPGNRSPLKFFLMPEDKLFFLNLRLSKSKTAPVAHSNSFDSTPLYLVFHAYYSSVEPSDRTDVIISKPHSRVDQSRPAMQIQWSLFLLQLS